MNSLINKIYESGKVEGKTGQIYELNSHIDRREGELLQKIIGQDISVIKTLEIGCAFGLSSLFICEAIQGRPGASHTSIDPFQNTQWDGVGLKHLNEAGYRFFTLLEEKSEFALPKLLQNREGVYDLIFIDGFHTFDHTLLDCFYSTRLLRVGGYLVVDDVMMPSVGRAVEYFKNYPCFSQVGFVSDPLVITLKRRIGRLLFSPVPDSIKRSIFSMSFQEKLYGDQQTRMVALRKNSDDCRSWDWYAPRF